MCISDLLWWHSHTPPSFFPFTPLRFLSPFVVSSGVGISVWWYTSLFFHALYIIRPVHWLLLLCGNFQGLAWGRVERKKERQTHSDNQRPQQFFMTHCIISLQEKWAGEKKRIESHVFIPSGGYEHISCCAVTWTHLLLWPTSISGPLRGF